MSITLVNKALYNHEQSKYAAMSTYPYGHPARYATYQEFNVQVVGSDDFHISEFAWHPIWTALQRNGWQGTIFPCASEKREKLLKALTALLDLPVGEPQIPNIKLPNDGNTIVMFNNQTVFDAIVGLIAFITRNDEIFAL